MREILFRGKRVDSGMWIQGYLFQCWGRAYILWGLTNNVSTMHEVIPETVGQFTGLKDKNGKMVFEGDILRANTGHRWEDGTIIRYPQYVQVIYNTKKARFEILGKLGESHKALNEVLERRRAVVVGNIHDQEEDV